MGKWGMMHEINRQPTGEYCRALVGSCKGMVGEIVYYHNWGGVDLQFEDGSMATFANDDVEEINNDS